MQIPGTGRTTSGSPLATPGGSLDGTHRAAVADGTVVGALRLLLPVQDDTSVARLDVAVHPSSRRRASGTALCSNRPMVAVNEALGSRRAGAPSTWWLRL